MNDKLAINLESQDKSINHKSDKGKLIKISKVI
jgi:hypothetical protein